jgi:hypothetical protein
MRSEENKNVINVTAFRKDEIILGCFDFEALKGSPSE